MKFLNSLKAAYKKYNIKEQNIPSTTAKPANVIDSSNTEGDAVKKISDVAKATDNKELSQKEKELNDLYKQIADALKMQANTALTSIRK